jgi:uncharacterized protein YndB with AHSA1/START domain
MGMDRIEKRFVVKAPRARVWKAIADFEQFGAWFGVKLESGFEAGKAVRGKITFPGYEHLTLEMKVEKLEPERLFSYRWHPYAVDPKVDYSAEPTTLVEFSLEDGEGGTHVTIVESGFEGVPLARRAEAFRMNEGGWTAQALNLERHVAKSQ